MMAEHLLLRLEAPLMSFGSIAVDHHRPVTPWPAASMLTGLFGNALGWRRGDGIALDALQARLRWAMRLDRAGDLLNDMQNARLAAGDRGWTTRGIIEERAGGAETYKSPHRRSRDYRADASLLVAVRLDPADDAPTLEQVRAALDRPARPLFLGRKGCPPSTRIVAGVIDASDTIDALRGAAGPDGRVASPRASLWCHAAEAPPEAADGIDGWRVHHTSDERRFTLDVHAGMQRVFERPGGLAGNANAEVQ